MSLPGIGTKADVLLFRTHHFKSFRIVRLDRPRCVCVTFVHLSFPPQRRTFPRSHPAKWKPIPSRKPKKITPKSSLTELGEFGKRTDGSLPVAIQKTKKPINKP